MILQALKEYYDRKTTDPDGQIAPEGFERKDIPFVILIDQNGKFIELDDTREEVGSKLVGKILLLPRSVSRCGSRAYETTFLLWDHIGYLLQYPDSDIKAENQHKSWLKALDELPESLKEDEGVAAVIKFYESDGVRKVRESSNWEDCISLKSCNMTFRLAGDSQVVPCRPAVQEFVRQSVSCNEHDCNVPGVARCIVTGEIGEIARIHSNTPINRDSKKLVGFQKNSGYDSYGKEQGFNAPVSTSAEFAYTTALNVLLKSTDQRMLVGDAVTIFWSEKNSDLETDFSKIFNEPPKDDPDVGVKVVRSLYKSVENGALSVDDKDNKFYVLGLAPNSARISVRFWIADTVKGMAEKILRHFDDLRIVHGPRDRDTLSLFRLLVSTAVQGKSENIPPNLGGETMRAILQGLPYPQTLLQAVIRRIRAEHDISYARASLIKACINRASRFKDSENKEELKVSLDKSNTNIGYRLGRLFAALEKIQSEANPGLNATIRDRFYGAASGTPVAVFSNLMRLKNHHLAKLENVGRRVNFERLIAEIMDSVEDFPGHLALADQGRFAIGYYHQMQDFYTKKIDKTEDEGEKGNE